MKATLTFDIDPQEVIAIIQKQFELEEIRQEKQRQRFKEDCPPISQPNTRKYQGRTVPE